LPEELDSRKVVLWLYRGWDSSDLILAGRYHRSTPITATSLRLSLHLKVRVYRWKQEKTLWLSWSKVASTEPDLELERTENVLLDHHPREMFRFQHLQWNTFVDFLPPKATVQVRQEQLNLSSSGSGSSDRSMKVVPFYNPILDEVRLRMNGGEWWHRGLQPLFPSPEGEFDEVDWATIPGTSDWRSEWKDAVRGEMGWLSLPPLVTPRQMQHRVILLWMVRLSSSSALTIRSQYHRNIRRMSPLHFRLILKIQIARKMETDFILERSENIKVTENSEDAFTFTNLPWDAFKEDVPPKATVRISRPCP
jgi:hypothetical protein